MQTWHKGPLYLVLVPFALLKNVFNYQCDLFRLQIIDNIFIMHSFINSIRYFKRYLLSILPVPGTVLLDGDTAVNKTGRNYCPQENSTCTILNASGIAKKKGVDITSLFSLNFSHTHR